MNTYGRKLRLSIFGESRGAASGVTIDGLPAGITVDFAKIDRELLRRAPRTDGFSTSRKEKDEYAVLSGVFRGKTNGAPLCAVFPSADAKPDSMPAGMVRPSHADYAAHVKHNGMNDPRGGGHFSGRLTLPLVFAGAVARQLLEQRGVTVGSHILFIGNASDAHFDPVNVSADKLNALDPMFPLVNVTKRDAMLKELQFARAAGDSVGGSVECAAVGMPVGAGEPFFDSLESCISHLLFSIPAVKAVEFGAGEKLSHMRASDANDEFYCEGGAVKTYTNNSGGLNGGLTNGMPVIVRTSFRPVPTIARSQRTVDLRSMENVTYTVDGRNDICVLPRAAVAVEAAVCIALLDALMEM